jgi:acyl carrier protein
MTCRRDWGAHLDTRREVLSVLDDVLSLKGRSASFRDDMPLITGLPELDSMAVASVLTALEERFGFSIDDDEIDAGTFETVGSLVAFVRGKRQAAA